MAYRRQQLWGPAVAITALFSQYSVLLTSMAQAKDKEKAHWNELEISELVDYYHQNRLEFAEGNPKPKIFNSAAEHIAPHLTQGPRKTGKMCKTKWVSVCYHY